MSGLIEHEAPDTIRARAAALTDYLLAVRGQLERPARAVPAGSIWQNTLPAHPLVQCGPGDDGSSWLRVGRPAQPKDVTVPRDLRAVVVPGAEPRFDGDEPLRPAFDTWLDGTWRPWATQAKAIEDTRELHRRLSDLRHQIDMQSVTEELVWGHGILHLEVAGQRVRYPLVVTPVAIDYDVDGGLISVAPQGPARLQTDPLTGLDDRYLRQLLALGEPGGLVTVDLWDEFERRELFERALRRLGQDPTIRAADAPDPGEPHVHDTGVLFVRPRQRLLRRFLEELRDRLLAGDPGSIETVGALASVLAHEPSALRMPGDDPDAWKAIGERLLMPLPTNEAQESIARRLARSRNVAVQGPPGTGKTHTIRNLICHLMAHGKRVLVVAQKEDPLRVLRDGLPAEVQALCLAVLGRSADQLVQLQLAARELSDRGATLDQGAEQRRVDRLTGQLEETERELGRALAALRGIAESEAATYEIDGAPLGPADVGGWLRAREDAVGDIPDALDGGPPLTADEFTVLLGLAGRLAPADRVQAMRALPVAAELPTADRVRADRARLAETEVQIRDLVDARVDLDGVRALGEAGLGALVDRLRDAARLLRAREGGWVDRLGRRLTDPHWQQLWSEHVTACRTAFDQLAADTRAVAGHAVTVPDGYPPRRLQDELAEVRQRFAAGRGVSRVFHSGLAKLVADCQVDGEPLRRVEDVDVVVAHVRRGQVRQQLAGRWGDWAGWLAIPADRFTGTPELWAGDLLNEAETAVHWDRAEWPGLHATARRLLPYLESTPDSAGPTAAADLLERTAAVHEHDRLAAGQRSFGGWLQQGMTGTDAADLWRALDLSWQDPGLGGWDENCAEIRRLAALRPDVEAYLGLRSRLAVRAPIWTARIDEGTAAALRGSGADCLLRWRWRLAQTWFDRVVGDLDTELLGRRVEQARDRIRRLTRDLVVASAWLAVSRALDDRRRAALADWATSLRKIGKGTGRKAPHWQAIAQRAMTEAVDAVPVWVMSIDRAIELFPDGGTFDVVIIDEASQADMFSLPILSLAERAVVVGDDQQIGPQLNFVGDVRGLIGAHLEDVPSAAQFDPESSLYDHAIRRSERILLTEHFRCVPQIIDFSSLNYYDGKIQPLRTDQPTGLGPAVNAIHVPDGIRQPVDGFGDVNVAEAGQLVDRVATIVADPAYDGATIGVVSLLSTSGQAYYLLEQLRQRIGMEEMERRRMRVGDPYTFQGDERDVVLLSLVASARDDRVAAFTKRDYHRRVNVAASRARDQMWVYHSFQPADVPVDDARGMLLTYCQHVTSAPESTADLAERCESDFERAVLRHLVARGHHPLPQFTIGAYRIDFVLPMPDGRRLAIECDGDAYHGPEQWEADIRRQAILERVGNCVFVRIRASVFFRSPERALEPLWQRIEELRA